MLASVNLLKDRMIDKMSNVSRIIDKLKAKDLVSQVNYAKQIGVKWMLKSPKRAWIC